MTAEQPDIGEDRSLLLVDDDEPFLKRLAKAMEKRGFEVEIAESVAAGRARAIARPPAYAVCDLRLDDGNGLDVVEAIRERRPDARIVVLTGYGAIASADRVRWEHIQRVYELCDRNVSETARRLNMHRRTLQRILAKRSPK
jgi:two-component system response regulator RegA